MWLCVAAAFIAVIEDDGFSTGVRSSYADLHHFEDAELYLSGAGLSTGLPQLEVKFPEGAWGQKRAMMGSESHYELSADGINFGAPPQITWISGTPAGERNARKFAILMIDPDAPRRSKDGAMPGSRGPWVHWMALNCKESAADCDSFLPYEGPKPSSGTGEHRYIVILFQQVKPPPSASSLTDFFGRPRHQFDLEGFLKAFRESMVPRAMNFFYVRKDGEPANLAAPTRIMHTGQHHAHDEL